MAHIALPDGLPGILGPLTKYPESGSALRNFTQQLLRGHSPLSPAERELIAAYISRLNDCHFCAQSHTAASRHLFDPAAAATVDQVLRDPERAEVSDKLKALLAIAGKVQQGGRHVLPADVDRARRAGADDHEIHDTVLTAAAFCMFNRYVDGLATWAPEDPGAYDEMGAALARHGYSDAAPDHS